VLQTLEELIKVNIDEVMSPMMRKFDDLLALQRKSRKAAPKRLSIKDMIRATNTWSEIFTYILEERDQWDMS